MAGVEEERKTGRGGGGATRLASHVDVVAIFSTIFSNPGSQAPTQTDRNTFWRIISNARHERLHEHHRYGVNFNMQIYISPSIRS